MKIIYKFILSFSLIIFSAGTIGYFGIANLAENAMKKSYGEESAFLVKEILDKIDRSIHNRIEQLQAYSSDIAGEKALFDSNAQFEQLEDIQAYINQKDSEWTSVPMETITPFMQGLIGNDLSQEIRQELELEKFYKEKYGYIIFGEVFVTNKYGANMAQSKKTTDYYQGDEEWWQKAKQDGLFVGDIIYDESAEVYSLDIATRIEDEKGDCLGVIIVALNIEEVIGLLKEFEPSKRHEEHSTMHLELLTRDGKIIYTSGEHYDYKILELASAGLLSRIKEGQDPLNYFVSADFESHEEEILFAYAHSQGYKDYQGLGWIFVIKHETREVFKTVYELRNNIIGIILGAMLLFLAIALWLSQLIVNPIKALHRGVDIIENGNLGHRVGTKEKDEIGQLSRAFDKMTTSLKKSRTNIENKVKERTAELVKLNKYIVEEKDKIDAILQSIGDGVFVIDKDHKIIVFNEMASVISGFNAKEAIGKDYVKVLKFIYTKDDKVNDKFIQDALRTGKITSMSNHTVLIKKDGKRIPVADSAAPIKGGGDKIVGCVVVFRDVTREQELDQMKTDFVSIASHQLRTPLTGIQWMTERILGMKKLSPKIRGYLGDVQLSAQRLSGLVTDLLNVSRFEEGNIAIMPKKIELVSFINGYIKETSSLLAKKKLKLEFKNHPEKMDILADKTLLRNIIQSLISNSIEYTKENGEIEISLEEKGANFLFSVKDNGIGIPKEAQPTIFDKFIRAENAKVLKPSGSGLGLFLTKGAVDIIGGKIWLESEVNKGTTFYVELPIESKKKEGIKGFV